MLSWHVFSTKSMTMQNTYDTMIPVETGQDLSYFIRLENDFQALSDAVTSLGKPYARIAIITDSNVAPLYLKEAERALSGTGATVSSLVLPAGEEHKNLDSINTIYQFLIDQQLDRNDLLAALGGGVIGDMTGFAAATYLRGIDFIQLPTTLLADVDSSIGGKTGVDYHSYKNMVGAFKQPRLVYMNLSVLRSLPERQFSTGMAEIVKHACIMDEEYLTFLEANKARIWGLEPDCLLPMIRQSLLIKKKVVEEDPTEKGIRAILNFGHTLGHALEKESGFTLTHGEGVSLGTCGALFITHEKGLLSKEDCLRVERLLQAYHLPVRYQDFSTEQVLAATLHDKKRSGKSLRFILLDRLGQARIDTSVTQEEMRGALEYLKAE